MPGYSGTIWDKPLNVTMTIDPIALQQINAAWFRNAMQLGVICLIIGFLIGAGAVYFYYKRQRDQDQES